MGLRLALKSKSCRVLQNNFNDYTTLQMMAEGDARAHCPARIRLSSRRGLRAGVPPIAPALFNAIHVLLASKRIRTLKPNK
jgi:CO/xanthine dehydrogenase Mo-binding subunit